MNKKFLAFSLFLLFVFLLFFLNFKAKKNKKPIIFSEKKLKVIFCPIRGPLNIKVFDSKGNYSEEFQRVKLISYLIKKGCKKSEIIIEHSIPIGHRGKNFLRADLVVKKGDDFFLVAEIKKSHGKESMKSAIKHQLIPEMMILRSKYGIYFDGTKNSLLLVKKDNGIIKKRKLSSLFSRKFFFFKN